MAAKEARKLFVAFEIKGCEAVAFRLRRAVLLEAAAGLESRPFRGATWTFGAGCSSWRATRSYWGRSRWRVRRPTCRGRSLCTLKSDDNFTVCTGVFSCGSVGALSYVGRAISYVGRTISYIGRAISFTSSETAELFLVFQQKHAETRWV